jgi:hypothetical protein
VPGRTPGAAGQNNVVMEQNTFVMTQNNVAMKQNTFVMK